MVSYAEVKSYLSKREIPQLFESLMAGLMYHRPDDHIRYLQTCLDEVKTGGVSPFQWSVFVNGKKRKAKELPPVTPKKQEAWTDNSRQSTPLPPISARSRGSTCQHTTSDDQRTAMRNTYILYHNPPPILAPPKVPVIFVLGGLGSKIDSLCEEVVGRVRGLVHISTCSMLKTRMTIEGFYRVTSVPACAVVDSVLQAMSMVQSAKAMLVAGFPRNRGDIEEYRSRQVRMDGVVLVDFEEESLRKLLQIEVEAGMLKVSEVETELERYKQDIIAVAEYYDDRDLLSVVMGDQDAEEVLNDLVIAVDRVIETRSGISSEESLMMMKRSDLLEHSRQCVEAEKESPQAVETNSSQEENDASQKTSLKSEQTEPSSREVTPVYVGEIDITPLRESKVPIISFLDAFNGSLEVDRVTLMEKHRLCYVGFEALIQQEMESNSKEGRYLRQQQKKGEKPSSALSLYLLKKSMLADLSLCKGFVINGFPRSVEQAKRFEEEIREYNLMVVVYDDGEITKQRSMNRGDSVNERNEDELLIEDNEKEYLLERQSLVEYFGKKVRKITPRGDVVGELLKIVETVLVSKDVSEKETDDVRSGETEVKNLINRRGSSAFRSRLLGMALESGDGDRKINIVDATPESEVSSDIEVLNLSLDQSGEEVIDMDHPAENGEEEKLEKLELSGVSVEDRGVKIEDDPTSGKDVAEGSEMENIELVDPVAETEVEESKAEDDDEVTDREVAEALKSGGDDLKDDDNKEDADSEVCDREKACVVDTDVGDIKDIDSVVDSEVIADAAEIADETISKVETEESGSNALSENAGPEVVDLDSTGAADAGHENEEAEENQEEETPEGEEASAEPESGRTGTVDPEVEVRSDDSNADPETIVEEKSDPKTEEARDEGSKAEDAGDEGSKAEDAGDKGSKAEDAEDGSKEEDTRDEGSKAEDAGDGSKDEDVRDEGSKAEDARDGSKEEDAEDGESKAEYAGDEGVKIEDAGDEGVKTEDAGDGEAKTEDGDDNSAANPLIVDTETGDDDPDIRNEDGDKENEKADVDEKMNEGENEDNYDKNVVDEKINANEEKEEDGTEPGEAPAEPDKENIEGESPKPEDVQGTEDVVAEEENINTRGDTETADDDVVATEDGNSEGDDKGNTVGEVTGENEDKGENAETEGVDENGDPGANEENVHPGVEESVDLKGYPGKADVDGVAESADLEGHGEKADAEGDGENAIIKGDEEENVDSSADVKEEVTEPEDYQIDGKEEDPAKNPENNSEETGESKENHEVESAERADDAVDPGIGDGDKNDEEDDVSVSKVEMPTEIDANNNTEEEKSDEDEKSRLRDSFHSKVKEYEENSLSRSVDVEEGEEKGEAQEPSAEEGKTGDNRNTPDEELSSEEHKISRSSSVKSQKVDAKEKNDGEDAVEKGDEEEDVVEKGEEEEGAVEKGDEEEGAVGKGDEGNDAVEKGDKGENEVEKVDFSSSQGKQDEPAKKQETEEEEQATENEVSNIDESEENKETSIAENISEHSKAEDDKTVRDKNSESEDDGDLIESDLTRLQANEQQEEDATIQGQSTGDNDENEVQSQSDLPPPTEGHLETLPIKEMDSSRQMVTVESDRSSDSYRGSRSDKNENRHNGTELLVDVDRNATDERVEEHQERSSSSSRGEL